MYKMSSRCHLRVQGPIVEVIEVWRVLFHKSPEPLSLQGDSSNFLILRIEAHKTIRVSHAFWGPTSSGKEGLERGLLSCYSIFANGHGENGENISCPIQLQTWMWSVEMTFHVTFSMERVLGPGNKRVLSEHRKPSFQARPY